MHQVNQIVINILLYFDMLGSSVYFSETINKIIFLLHYSTHFFLDADKEKRCCFQDPACGVIRVKKPKRTIIYRFLFLFLSLKMMEDADQVLVKVLS